MDVVPYRSIRYHEVATTIVEPVTKFGGQPIWLGEPEWPMSRSLGTQMRFLCQVALEPVLFGPTAGKMAYIFISDPDDGYAEDTWELDSGENAVIVQPGRPLVRTEPLATGPTLMRSTGPSLARGYAPCEFAVTLEAGEEPAYVERFPGYEYGDLSYLDRFLLADKIGGSPHFVQWPQLPDEPGWRLLAQFGATPCVLPFGGLVYAFLLADGASGKMVWQA